MSITPESDLHVSTHIKTRTKTDTEKKPCWENKDPKFMLETPSPLLLSDVETENGIGEKTGEGSSPELRSTPNQNVLEDEESRKPVDEITQPLEIWDYDSTNRPIILSDEQPSRGKTEEEEKTDRNNDRDGFMVAPKPTLETSSTRLPSNVQTENGVGEEPGEGSSPEIPNEEETSLKPVDEITQPLEIWDYSTNRPIILSDEQPPARNLSSPDDHSTQQKPEGEEKTDRNNDCDGFMVKKTTLHEAMEEFFNEQLPESQTSEFTATKRALAGLSSLPFRLNTIERVRRDSELGRVFRGKYGKDYEFVPHAKKEHGVEIGTIYLKEHTCDKKLKKKRKKWLGKTSFANKGALDGNISKGLAIEVKNERGHNLSVLLEYIANCLYRVFGDGYYETPKYRLSRLPFSDEFTKDIWEVKHLQKKYGLKNTLRVLSKWCDDYRDFSELKVRIEGGEDIGFIEFVKKNRTIPEKVIEPESGNEVQLRGMMALLAAATSIGDIDSIGGTGANCGYVVDRNENHEVIAFNVVKVDPGLAFNFDRVRVFFEDSSDKRDIHYLSNTTNAIIWKNLSQEQRNEFLEVKMHHLEIIKSREILEYIFFRDEMFHDESGTIKMKKSVSDVLIDNLISHIKNEGKLFGEDIEEYKQGREYFLRKSANNDEDVGDYDRSLCKFEKLLELLKQCAVRSRETSDKVKIFGNIVSVNLDISRVEGSRGDLTQALCRALQSKRSFESVQPSDDTRIEVCSCLGTVYYRLGEFEKSIQNYEKSLHMKLISLPENHPSIAASYHNLGFVCLQKGEYEKAIRNYEKSLHMKLISLPENHPDIAKSYNNLGLVYWKKGEYEKALRNFEKIFADDVEILARKSSFHCFELQ